MKQVKPIIVVYGGSNICQEEVQEFREYFGKSDIAKEYWMMMFIGVRDETKVEVLNIKDVSEIDLKELKDSILKMLESGQTKM